MIILHTHASEGSVSLIAFSHPWHVLLHDKPATRWLHSQVCILDDSADLVVLLESRVMNDAKSAK